MWIWKKWISKLEICLLYLDVFYKIFHNHCFNNWIYILSQEYIWYCSILCMDSFQINAVVEWSTGGGQEREECPTTRSNSCEDKQETVLLTQTAVGEVALISQWDQQIIATAASRKHIFVPEDVCSVFYMTRVEKMP